MNTLNETPLAERLHIAIFGRRNAGKSSLINALTGQDIAIVSPVAGTTTDPVQKAMELPPLGPVNIIDTPGLDDEGELGSQRIERAYRILNKADIVLLVADASNFLPPMFSFESSLIERLQRKNIPFLMVFNKIDLTGGQYPEIDGIPTVGVSATSKLGIGELTEALIALKPQDTAKPLISDLLRPRDIVILVTPVDQSAPKGRLILPQQQVIRDIIDHGALALIVQPDRLRTALESLNKPPALVITDSQAFREVYAIVPPNIPLTSFSILFARRKGSLPATIKAAQILKHLRPGAKILISEGCSHRRQCGDIGTEKLPNLICSRLPFIPEFEFTVGGNFPADLSPYQLIIHCGGCMLTEREMHYRSECAADAGVPMTNYGIMLASLNGILERVIAPFPELKSLL